MIQHNGIRPATRLDIPEVNRILNHRDVRPTIGFPEKGVLDVSDSFDQYVVLMFSRSAFLIEAVDAFSVEVHSAVVPEDRGECAVKAAREGIKRTFLNTPVVLFLTKHPIDQKEAGVFATLCGFHRIRVSKTTAYWAQSLEDWLATQNPKALEAEIEAGGHIPKFQYAYTRLAHLFKEEQCPQPQLSPQ